MANNQPRVVPSRWQMTTALRPQVGDTAYGQTPGNTQGSGFGGERGKRHFGNLRT